MRKHNLKIICHKCPQAIDSKGRIKDGLCDINKAKIVDNCESGICPAGKFTPDQLERATNPPEPPPTEGVGTEIKSLLSQFGIAENVGCGCTAIAVTWDKNGIVWCEQHQQELTDHLIEQGRQRGWLSWAAAKVAAGTIVATAIERAKAK
jgi:hypothetical protein